MKPNDRNTQSPSTDDAAAKLAASSIVAKPANDAGTSPKRGGETKAAEISAATTSGERKDAKPGTTGSAGRTSTSWTDGKKR